ncbi:MAG: hypothetical protein LBK71_06460 [Verrucomicrobiales bacterium]|jgi:hypothetical protein|nr:hypothetical protein [Verrucomicrobiales bacterium]
MRKLFLSLLPLLVSVTVSQVRAIALPSPDDQGGMIMSAVTVSGGTLTLMFDSGTAPVLGSLDYWHAINSNIPANVSPGDAWYSMVDPDSGNGALINCQFGFAATGDYLPSNRSLGIKLTAASADLLQAWNYNSAYNRFAEVFSDIGDQVLWNGGMWHPYFTLPADSAPGLYSATFDIFVADALFTEGTGAVDYSASALSAQRDSIYNLLTLTYQWEVIPEPSAWLLLAGGLLALTVSVRYLQPRATA